jgi:hypothetical protein
MKKLLGIVVLGLLLSGNAYAGALTLKDYKLLENSDAMDLYIEGLLQGSKWTNAITKKNNEDTKNLKRAFCPPTEMVLELANAKTIVNRSIEDLSKIYTETELESVPIVQVLLLGLERTFPCK